MKYLLLVIFVFFFVLAPMYLLNSVVMPQVMSLKNTYASAGQTTDDVVSGASH